MQSFAWPPGNCRCRPSMCRSFAAGEPSEPRNSQRAKYDIRRIVLKRALQLTSSVPQKCRQHIGVIRSMRTVFEIYSLRLSNLLATWFGIFKPMPVGRRARLPIATGAGAFGGETEFRVWHTWLGAMCGLPGLGLMAGAGTGGGPRQITARIRHSSYGFPIGDSVNLRRTLVECEPNRMHVFCLEGLEVPLRRS
jgi:hypothetical protein